MKTFGLPDFKGAKSKAEEKGFLLLEYDGADEKCTVKCLKCGRTFEYNSFHNLMTLNKEKRFCPYEWEKEKNIGSVIARLCETQSDYLKQQKQKEDRDRHTMNKLIRRLKQFVIVKHECQNCGEEFWAEAKRKFCSAKCNRRYQDKMKDHRKRKAINTRRKDDGITLEIVYKKANGRCYLCGCKCDYDDYIIKDGTHIAGNKYPSIEHIKPLAKGGTHTWDNVALACRQCNSRKSAKTIQQITLPI